MNTFEMFFQIFFSPKCFVADEAFKVFWSLFDAHYFQCLHLKIVQLAKNRRMFFFKKMGQSRPLFCLFSFFSSYNFNNTNWKKLWWCAWDLNPGPQAVRRWRNHGAMAATHLAHVWSSNSVLSWVEKSFDFASVEFAYLTLSFRNDLGLQILSHRCRNLAIDETN